MTVPIGGNIDLSRTGADDGPEEFCGLADEVPTGTLTLSRDGDELTIVSDFPEYKVSTGECVR